MQKTLLATICLLSILSFPVSASGTVEADIPVSCTAEGYGGSFQYSLSADTDIHQDIQKESMQLKDRESGMFTVAYDYPGTYHYEVSQASGTDPDVAYDTAVYDVDVYVTEDENGVMHTETVAYKNRAQEKSDGCRYVNTYTPAKGSEKGNAQQGTNAKTGDETPAGPLAMLLMLSGASIVWLLRRFRHREERP